mgnify:CR=1 FL=1
MARYELINFPGILTPEQLDFINCFYSMFDFSVEGSGLNRHINNIEPLFYTGAIAATEFVTYAATKLYICFDISATRSNSTGGTSPRITIYNENDIIVYYLTMAECYRTASNYNMLQNFQTIKPFYFSRIATNQYQNFKFIGYRITLN